MHTVTAFPLLAQPGVVISIQTWRTAITRADFPARARCIPTLINNYHFNSFL